MEVFFILLAIPIFLLTLLITIGTIVRFVGSFNHIYELSQIKKEEIKPWVYKSIWFNYKVSPIIISIIAPLGGFYVSLNSGTPLKYDNDIYSPLSHDHILTIFVFYAVSVIAYWTSYSTKKEPSPLLSTFTILGMLQGLILCIALTIQFGPWVIAGFIPILITFPLLSPFLFALLLFVEIRRQYYGFKEELLNKEDFVYDSLVLSTAQKVVQSPLLDNPILFILLLPFIAIQQAILILFGQEADSSIKAFIETCTFTFSQLPEPPAPDGHYLCTIASRGNKKLVKPLRKGWRGGKIIDVNRQLLVANAFEEWLEDTLPMFHLYLRKFYTKIGQPLNKIVQSPNISNCVFILMKPLEWFFICWLYLVYTKPENRIHKQYLPAVPKEKK